MWVEPSSNGTKWPALVFAVLQFAILPPERERERFREL